MDERPLKVSTRSVPGATSEPLARTPMRAAPMRSGTAPNSFETRMRTRLPPMLVWTIRRRVWSVKVCRLAGAVGPAGAVPQVPVQRSLFQPWALAPPPGRARMAARAAPASTRPKRERRVEIGRKFDRGGAGKRLDFLRRAKLNRAVGITCMIVLLLISGNGSSG